MHSPDTIKKQEFSDTLPSASLQDLGVILMGAGYEVTVYFENLVLIYLFHLSMQFFLT